MFQPKNEEELLDRVVETKPGFVGKFVVIESDGHNKTIEVVGGFQNLSDNDRIILASKSLIKKLVK